MGKGGLTGLQGLRSAVLKAEAEDSAKQRGLSAKFVEAEISAILEKAEQNNKRELAAYRIRRFLLDLRKEFC
jgi:hypothetical protein